MNEIFFYGLFMDTSILSEHGVAPSRARVGYVEGYRLHIGARATLTPDAEGRAYGVLMPVRPEEAQVLYSGASVADYVPETLTVVLADGSQVSAAGYNLPPSKWSGRNREYARKLLQLARQLGFPQPYLDEIEEQAR